MGAVKAALSDSPAAAVAARVAAEWFLVPGAAGYTVEIDCFECCGAGWCSDVGREWMVARNLDRDFAQFFLVWLFDRYYRRAQGREGSGAGP